jgi:hypothetical protein
MKFKELSDAEWGIIKLQLPPPASTDRPRADDRKKINGILYVATTGFKWRDMPHKRLRCSGNRMETAQELAGEGRMELNRKRGIKANIPVDKKNRTQTKRGRPFRFDKESYADRSAVERLNSWIES